MNSVRTSSSFAFVVCAAVAVSIGSVARANAQPAPSPTPSATRSASSGARPSESQIHRAIVVCEPAFFYTWPDRNSAPSRTAYPPGRVGDAFDVIGDGTLGYVGLTLYETTIDVYSPFGSRGKHYWISAECVNAG